MLEVALCVVACTLGALAVAVSVLAYVIAKRPAQVSIGQSRPVQAHASQAGPSGSPPQIPPPPKTPQPTPEQIAPSLRAPPRVHGGFGSKSTD